MLCPSCQKDIGFRATFCRYCGTNISSVQGGLVSAGYAEPINSEESQEQSHEEVLKNRSFFSRIGGVVGGLIGLVVIYGVVNGVLWFGQEAYHHEDTVKLEQLEVKINGLKSKIESFESTAEKYGTTDAGYASYESMITEHNKLIGEYNALAKDSGTRWYVIPVPSGKSHVSQ